MPKLSAGCDMHTTAADPLMEQSPTRASARATTRSAMLNTISDRVQQSQEQHQAHTSNVSLQHNPNANSPSQESQSRVAPKNTATSSSDQAKRPSSSRRYERAALIELGKDFLKSSEVLLKVKPEAIAENLFQYMGSGRSLRPMARSHGLSDISNLSHRSMISSNGPDDWEPSRQPRPAPQASDFQQTSRLQHHEGFVRFLKQHASPPHQRVTAGGRIVPTGPLSPPPMFDYASLNGLVHGQQPNYRAPISSRSKACLKDAANPLSASSQSRLPTSFLPIQSGQLLGPQSVNPSTANGTSMENNVQYALQTPPNSMAQSPLTPLALVPLGLLPDGTALISCNGVCYRSYWNGVTTILEPLTTGPTIPSALDASSNSIVPPFAQSSYGDGALGTMRTPTSSQNISLAPTGLSTLLQTHQSQPTGSTDNNLPISDEKAMKTQLSVLDKHLALHHYEIGYAERTRLISQRKTLVQAIARLRLDREPTNQTIPIVAAPRNGSRKSSMQPDLTTRHMPTPQQTKGNPSRDLSMNDKKSLKTILSPSAPAFVPCGTLNPFTANTNEGSELEKSSAATLTRPLRTVSNTSTGGINQKPDKASRETSSDSQSPSRVEVDPWDPAMRIIPPSMIEYAQEYESEGAETEKNFCTTIEEFQEAMRRVREQARMWGCVGGNSKDPAYDAEEDIWYAIKDKYPIPLPTKVPDHITCPRPWNWYDSAFNVKATIEPRINMRGDTFEDIYFQPKAEAMSTKYSFVKGSQPTKKHSEATEGIHDLAVTGLTPIGSGHLPADEMPLRTQNRDSLLDRSCNQEQNFRAQVGKMDESYHVDVDSFGIPDVRKSDTAIYPKASADSGKLAVQKRDILASFNNESKSSPVPLALDLMRRMYSQVERAHQQRIEAQVPPSSTATPATYAASGSDIQWSGYLEKSECQSRKSSWTIRNHDHNQACNIFPVNNLQQNSPQNYSSSPTRNACPEVARGNANFKILQLRKSPSIPSEDDADHKTHSANGGNDESKNVAASGFSAESKVVWGPEQHGTAAKESKAPKVKIPASMNDVEPAYNRRRPTKIRENGHHGRFKSKKQVLSAHEVKFENVAGIPDNNTETFLKDMLRNPRYSFLLSHNEIEPVESLMANQAEQNEGGRKVKRKMSLLEQYEPQTMDKENASSARGIHGSNLSIGYKGNNHTSIMPGSDFRLSKNISKPPTLTTNKANSSLASSKYQAQGYLPPFDGAGMAQTASIYRQQPRRVSYRKARVILPLSSSYTLQGHSSDQSDRLPYIDQILYGSDAPHMPTSFGYDGSGSPTPTNDLVGEKAKAKEQEKSTPEIKSVTAANFDQYRPDHDNELHRETVNGFFQDLHETEVKYMMARQRKNTKTVP